MDALQLELLIRGIVVGGNLLLAAVFLARPPRNFARFATGMFALGVAAYAVLSFPGVKIAEQPWFLLLLPLAAANSAFLWLIARIQFEEGFAPAPRHLAAWLVLVAITGARVLVAIPTDFAEQPWWMRVPQAAIAAILIGWSLLVALRDFAADMVERRRRLRIVFIVAICLYAAAILAFELVWGPRPAPAWTSLLNAGLLALVTLAFGGAFLEENFSQLPAAGPKPRAAPTANPAKPASQEAAPLSPLARQVLHVVQGEKLYREPGLSIGGLAARLKTPEHRLRAAINNELGFRNFNTFLNGFRLAECKAALADPDQAEVPVITIALDSGFQSMPTFNRVFKAETGLSPTEYRRKGGAG